MRVKLLDSIRADIKKEAAEQERQLLLKVLQRRSGDLTLGELFQVLGSPLGQGIHAVRVAELFAAAPAAASGTSSATPDESMKKTTKAKAKAKRKGRAQSRKPQATTGDNATRTSKRAPAAGTKPAPPKVSALTVEGRKQYDAALLNYLRKHPGPNRPADVRSVVGGSEIQFRIAMDRLRTAGLIERIGQFGTTTYAAKGSATGSSEPQRTTKKSAKKRPSAGSSEPQRTAKKSAKKRTQVAGTSSPPVPIDDTAVISAIKELGGGVSSSQILGKVGGSIDALREALRRLVSNGSVRREGERKFTRYALASDG